MRIRRELTSAMASKLRIFKAQGAQSAEKQMTYLVAGTLAQPELAFEFMRSKFGENYTYVDFSRLGWRAKPTAQRIAEDIREHNYRAKIFTISLGDHVARHLEAEPDLRGRIEVYAINPCPNRTAVREPFRTLLRFSAPMAEILCHLLGWLSVLPIIPCDGGLYSLMLAIDQFHEIYYDSPPLDADQTRGVVWSARDSFLRKESVQECYPQAKMVEIDARHGKTIQEAEKHYNAISTLI